MNLFLLCLFAFLALIVAKTEKEPEVEVYFKIKHEDVVLKFPPRKDASDKMAKRVCLEKIKNFETKEDEKECIDAMQQFLDLKVQEFLSGVEENEEDVDEEIPVEEEKKETKEIKKSKLKVKKESKESTKDSTNSDKTQPPSTSEEEEISSDEVEKINDSKKKFLTEVEVRYFVKGTEEDPELHIILAVPTPADESENSTTQTEHEIIYKPHSDSVKEVAKSFCSNHLQKIYGSDVNEHFLTLCMAPLAIKIDGIWALYKENKEKKKINEEL